MTQTMRFEDELPVTYYRNGGAHPTHNISSAFTRDAKRDYAARVGCDDSEVELGPYRSGQGVPQRGILI